MNDDRKLNVLQIVYIQQDEDNYKLVRFAGMDEMRAALKQHGISIGQNVSIGREVLIADGVTIGSDTVIAPEATLEKGVRIGKGCQIDKDAFIGRNTRIGDHVSIGEKAELGRMVIVGDDSELAPECIVQDNVHIGFGSRIRTMAYIGNESVLGHHTVVGAQSKLGRLVRTAPSTVVDAHRVVQSFMTVSGTGNDLHLDEELKRHHAMRSWPVFVGGEKPKASEKAVLPVVEEQQPRRVLSW